MQDRRKLTIAVTVAALFAIPVDGATPVATRILNMKVPDHCRVAPLVLFQMKAAACSYARGVEYR
jgi:uncharacterized membrane protein YraQ (UPF0718 family)